MGEDIWGGGEVTHQAKVPLSYQSRVVNMQILPLL